MNTDGTESGHFNDDIVERVRNLCWCGIYTRQSRDTNSEYSSCAAQCDACFAFVRSHFNEGWVPNGHRYEDEAESSETLERPGLQRLLEQIHDGNIGRVVIYRLDRISRRLVDCISFLRELREREIPLTIVTQPELSTNAEHSLLLNMMASFAEFEQEMTRERLADARVAHKRRGRRVAGVVPYGYAADPVTKQLIVEPPEAKRVQQIFQWATEGKTSKQIAELANRRGWRTKNASNVHGSQEGGRWTPRQVLATLSNPVYQGTVRDGDAVLQGCHEAVVSEEVFDRAQEAVASRRTRKPGRQPEQVSWPLRGILFCGQCERVMSPSMSSHGTIVYRYYRCRSHAGGRPPCRGVSVPAHEIEQYVFDLLGEAETWSADNEMTEQQAKSTGKFAAVWTALGDVVAHRLLPSIVRRVVYGARRSTIAVTIDEHAIDHLRGKTPNGDCSRFS